MQCTRGAFEGTVDFFGSLTFYFLQVVQLLLFEFLKHVHHVIGVFEQFEICSILNPVCICPHPQVVRHLWFYSVPVFCFECPTTKWLRTVLW